MKIIVSEYGKFWTPDTPVLEKYKNEVVCFYAGSKEKKHDKYQSIFIDTSNCPTVLSELAQVNMILEAICQDGKAQDQILNLLKEEKDLLFLTDFEESSFTPYRVFMQISENCNLHLVTMSPWKYMGYYKLHGLDRALGDRSLLKSLTYINSEKMIPAGILVDEVGLFRSASAYLQDLLKEIHDKIPKLGEEKYSYDFDKKQYVVREDPVISRDAIMEHVIRGYSTETFDDAFPDIDSPDDEMGVVDLRTNEEDLFVDDPAPDLYGDLPGQRFTDGGIGEEVTERSPHVYDADIWNAKALRPRSDGKQLCEELKRKRVELAELNGIPFSTEECTSEEPCAGTCPKCDAEAEYLRTELEKIPVYARRFPSLDIEEKD